MIDNFEGQSLIYWKFMLLRALREKHDSIGCIGGEYDLIGALGRDEEIAQLIEEARAAHKLNIAG